MLWKMVYTSIYRSATTLRPLTEEVRDRVEWKPWFWVFHVDILQTHPNSAPDKVNPPPPHPAWSAGMFGQVICVTWYPHECQDPGFLSRFLHRHRRIPSVCGCCGWSVCMLSVVNELNMLACSLSMWQCEWISSVITVQPGREKSFLLTGHTSVYQNLHLFLLPSGWTYCVLNFSWLSFLFQAPLEYLWVTTLT